MARIALTHESLTEADSTRLEAIDNAVRSGFDWELIKLNLSLAPGERWRQHDMALAVVLELERARLDRDARLQTPATTTR